MKNAISPPKFCLYDNYLKQIVSYSRTFSEACRTLALYQKVPRPVEIYLNPAWVSAKPGREHQ